MAAYLGGLALVWLVPLAWGSTWLLDHGRVTGVVVWLLVFGWWALEDPEHVARHRRPARRDRKRRGMP